MQKRLKRKPFSKLSIKEQFERLFERGYTREEAEKKLRHPYRALILPGQIAKYWERANGSQEGLTGVWMELGQFRLEVDYSGSPYRSGESLLRGIADQILGQDFEYEIDRDQRSGLPIGVVITAYNGVFV